MDHSFLDDGTETTTSIGDCSKQLCSPTSLSFSRVVSAHGHPGGAERPGTARSPFSSISHTPTCAIPLQPVRGVSTLWLRLCPRPGDSSEGSGLWSPVPCGRLSCHSLLQDAGSKVTEAYSQTDSGYLSPFYKMWKAFTFPRFFLF